MNERINLYIIPFLLVLLFACKKSNKTTAKDVYTFDNSTGTLSYSADLYASKEDYLNLVNPFKHFIIAANQLTTIPMSELTDGKLYYLDYYSNDYEVSNWGIKEHDLRKGKITSGGIKFIAEKDGVYHMRKPLTTMRRVLLGKSNISTWKAIGAYDDMGNDIWDTLAVNAKDFSLICTPYKIAKHAKTNLGNVQITELLVEGMGFENIENIPGMFKLSGGYPFPVYIYNCGKLIRFQDSPYDKTPSSDTLCLAQLRDYSYILVRQ